jgi:beta-lactamase regulating signal transducer with metallopeptidase domain
MKILDTLLSSSTIQISGWVLLHSIWQGILLAILLKGALNLLKRSSANTRYLIACITLLLMLLLPVSTTFWSSSKDHGIDSANKSFQVKDSNEKVIMSPETYLQANISEIESTYRSWIHQAEKQFLPWLVLIWLLGVLVSSLRLAGIWTYTQQLKLNGEHLVLEPWKETLHKLSWELRVSRPVILIESSLVKVPGVVGWIKPMILIPSYALTGLTPQQFELILAHELAHIRRHDYLVNLFQTIIETLFFYHPAVWWVSSQVRKERENACDDLAISIGGDASVYARTLIEIERLRKINVSLAMAADGASLTMRVHRLIGIETSGSERLNGLWGLLFIGIFIISFIAYVKNPYLVNTPRFEEQVPNIPFQNISKLEASKQTAHKVITGDWTAKPKSEESNEIIIVFYKNPRSRGNISNDTFSINQLEGFEPEALSSAESKVNFKVSREVGIFEFEGDFGQGKGAGSWSLIPSEGFVSNMEKRGYINLTETDLFYAAVNNINNKYIEDFESAGYRNLTFKQFIEASMVGITPERIKRAKELGYTNVSFEQLMKLRETGIVK